MQLLSVFRWLLQSIVGPKQEMMLLQLLVYSALPLKQRQLRVPVTVLITITIRPHSKRSRWI